MSAVEFDLTALLLELRRARDDDHADDEDETTDSELARTPSERREFIEDLCLELTDGDACDVVRDDVTRRKVTNAIRAFGELGAIERARLMDAMCSNLSVLCASASAREREERQEGDEEISWTRAALKAYVGFIFHVCERCEKESTSFDGVAAVAAAGKGKKAKTKSQLVEWRWDEQRERVVHVMAGVLDVDLWQVFRPKQPEEEFLLLFVRLGSMCLENSAAMKSKVTKRATFEMMGSCALKWGQLEQVTTALIHLLNKCEHLPGPIAELASNAADRFENAHLAAALIREVGRVDPYDYKVQQASDAVGVRCIGAFLSEIAERMPKTTMTNMSMLMPHLDGEAYSLRSAIVSVLGHLLISQKDVVAVSDHHDNGTAPLLRSKQGFLDLLVERVHDTSAFTRARVLNTWATMAEAKAIPLSHWLVVADLAIGRLHDKGALVRKAAMGLLASLLGYNPFAPQLPSATFAESLKDYEAKLASMTPPADENEEVEEVKHPDAPQKAQNAPTEGDANAAVHLGGGIEAVRTMVAALKTALGFTVQLSGTVAILCNLLTSSVASDVTEAIGLLVRMRQFNVDGSTEGIRRLLGLIFSRDQVIKDAVVEAVDVLYLSNAESPLVAAAGLSELAATAALGELAALEDVLKALVLSERLPSNGAVTKALWSTVSSSECSNNRKAAAINVLTMCARTNPEIVRGHIGTVCAAIEASLSGEKKSPTLCRAACCALTVVRAKDGEPLERGHPVFAELAKVLHPAAPLAGRAWFPSAEQAISALYSLHPDPEHTFSEIIKAFATATFSGNSLDKIPTAVLARFLFVLGEVSLRHLVHIEKLARSVRMARIERDRKAVEAKENGEGDDNDLAAAMGEGAVTEDLLLDNTRERVESELLAMKGAAHGLIAIYAPFVVQLCSHPAVVQGPELLRGAALAALTRFMVLDVKFCEDHLKLIFARLKVESDKGTRAAIIVALGDLAFRFPNAVEPWTEHLYGIKEWGNSLHDTDAGVRQHAITVLSHLVLNDMMKVKGHISEMARCLEDPDPRVAGVAKLFFHELAQKHGNPVYNLLTDLLSRLSRDEDISPDAFKRIMTRLVGFIDKERQAESLCEKMCARFAEAVLAETPKPARDIAFCISQLNLSEKAFKKFTEAWKQYEAALYDHEVHASFIALCQKQKRAAKPEAKQFIEAYEAKLNESHVERAAAYNVSARAEGKETVAVTVILKEEEDVANEALAETDEANLPECEGEATEENAVIDETVERATSKTSGEQDENVAPKIATPPVSPPKRRSRKAAV